jgi:hypothetical protein
MKSNKKKSPKQFGNQRNPSHKYNTRTNQKPNNMPIHRSPPATSGTPQSTTTSTVTAGVNTPRVLISSVSGNTSITQTPHMRNATPLNMTFALNNDGTPLQSDAHLQVPASTQQDLQLQSSSTQQRDQQMPALTASPNGEGMQLSTASAMQAMQTQMEQMQSNMTHLAANVNGKYRAMQQGIADTIESTIDARLADQEQRFSQQFQQLAGSAGLESIFAPPAAVDQQSSATAQSTTVLQPQQGDTQLVNNVPDRATTGIHSQTPAAIVSPLSQVIQRHTAMHPPPPSIRQPAPVAPVYTQPVSAHTVTHAVINNAASTAAGHTSSTFQPTPQVLNSVSQQQLLQQQLLQQQLEQQRLLQHLNGQAVASSTNLMVYATQQQPTALVNNLPAYNLNHQPPMINQSTLCGTVQPTQAQTITVGSVQQPFTATGTQLPAGMQHPQTFPTMAQVPPSNNNTVIGSMAPQLSAQSPNSLIPDSTTSTAPFGEDAHILQELIEQHKRKSGVQHMNSRAMTTLLGSQAATQLRDADIVSTKTLQPYEFGGTASFPIWLNRFEIYLAIKNITDNDAKVLAMQQYLGEKAYQFFLSLPDQTKLNYDKLKATLAARFTRNMPKLTQLTRACSLKQRPNESVMQFYHRFLTEGQINGFEDETAEHLIAAVFMQQLRPEIRKKLIIVQDTTLDHMIQMASAIEFQLEDADSGQKAGSTPGLAQYKKFNDHNAPTRYQNQSQQNRDMKHPMINPHSANATQQSQSNLMCRTCGKYGHSQHQCPNNRGSQHRPGNVHAVECKHQPESSNGGEPELQGLFTREDYEAEEQTPLDEEWYRDG